MIALLIVDMQKGILTKETPRYESGRVVRNITALAEGVRTLGGKGVFIQHDGNKEEGCLPGTEEWEFIPEIRKTDADVVIHKMACDSFYDTELDRYLWNMQYAKWLSRDAPPIFTSMQP